MIIYIAVAISLLILAYIFYKKPKSTAGSDSAKIAKPIKIVSAIVFSVAAGVAVSWLGNYFFNEVFSFSPTTTSIATLITLAIVFAITGYAASCIDPNIDKNIPTAIYITSVLTFLVAIGICYLRNDNFDGKTGENNFYVVDSMEMYWYSKPKTKFYKKTGELIRKATKAEANMISKNRDVNKFSNINQKFIITKHSGDNWTVELFTNEPVAVYNLKKGEQLFFSMDADCVIEKKSFRENKYFPLPRNMPLESLRNVPLVVRGEVGDKFKISKT
jgi:hypothetical protein